MGTKRRPCRAPRSWSPQDVAPPRLIAAAALASLAIAGAANAATDTLSLTGVVADSVYEPYSSGGVSYEEWILPLSGLDSANGPTVSQGDEVDATISFDKKVSISAPATSSLTSSLVLFGGDFSSTDNQTSGTTTFFNGPSQADQGSAGFTAFTTLGFSASLLSPVSIIFDSIGLKYNIIGLAQPSTLESATLYMYVPNGSFSAGGGGGGVPEPAAWNLMLVGFGALGAALRSRRRSAALAA